MEPPRGADLAFQLRRGEAATVLEVKGTADSAVAYAKLKVSGRPSYDLLVTKKAKLIRVIGVFQLRPSIVELVPNTDFELVPEPRWRVKTSTSITAEVALSRRIVLARPFSDEEYKPTFIGHGSEVSALHAKALERDRCDGHL